MKAEPSWSRQAIFPTSLTTALALGGQPKQGGDSVLDLRKSEEDTESSPELPSHDESPSVRVSDERVLIIHGRHTGCWRERARQRTWEQ